jgi:uncharacterized membrane protein
MNQAIVDTLAAMQRDGTLSPDQRAEVERRLAAALAPTDQSSRFVVIVGSLGAVLCAAGILYLVGYNWEALSKGTKLGLIFGLWSAIHAAGAWLSSERGRHPLLGTAFTTLGVLSFGAAIGLVAQIYHLSAHYPNSVLAWWLLNVPVLLWSRSRSVQVAVTGVFVVWCFWHLGVYMDDLTWYRHEVVGFGLLGAGLSVVFTGLSLVVAGTRWAVFGGLWRGLGWAFALAAPFVLAFEGLWHGLDWGGLLATENRWTELRPLHGYVVALVVGLPLVGVGQRRVPSAIRTVAILVGTALVLGLLCCTVPIVMPIAANLVTLAQIVGMVRVGTREGRQAPVVVAVVVFCIVVFVRYTEYLWDKLEGAFAFLGLGVLLLAAGWFLERQRRRILVQREAMR